MKKAVYCSIFFILIFSLTSCFSSGRIVVPGENEIIGRNLIEEYFAIAEQFRSQENYEKAITYYTKVLKDAKLHDTAFYEIAICRVYTKKWDEARDSFRILLKRDPENINLRKSLAYIEAMDGNLKKAEKMYALLIEEFPGDDEMYKNYINVLVAMEKFKKALEQVDQFAEKFPDDDKIEVFRTKIKELQEEPKVKENSKDKKDSDKNKDKKEDGDESEDSKSENKDDEDLFGLNEESKDKNKESSDNKDGSEKEKEDEKSE